MNPVLLQAPGSTTHLAEERRMSGGSLISRFSRPATQAFRPNLLPRADPAVTVTTVVHFIYGTTGLVTKHCSRKINVPRIILYGHARHSMTELVNREAAANQPYPDPLEAPVEGAIAQRLPRLVNPERLMLLPAQQKRADFVQVVLDERR